MLHRQPLLAARVVDQPNRFTVRVRIEGDPRRPVGAYLSNTGNLRSILVPGAEVRVTPAPNPGGKLPYHLVLARQWGRWVAVDANLRAFSWGRIAAHDPDVVAEIVKPLLGEDEAEVEEDSLDNLVAKRSAYLESYQDERGRIHIPEVLKPYMAGIEVIG